MFSNIQTVICYIRKRLNERSTWVAFGTGVAGAAALSMPWSAVFCAFAIIGVMVPDGDVKPS